MTRPGPASEEFLFLAPPQRQSMPDPDTIRRLCRRIKLVRGHWKWMGHKDKKGYGQIRSGGRAHWAHRISYATFVGDIPEGMVVHHKCNKTWCIKPSHLSLETPLNNVREENERRAQEAQEAQEEVVPF